MLLDHISAFLILGSKGAIMLVNGNIPVLRERKLRCCADKEPVNFLGVSQ